MGDALDPDLLVGHVGRNDVAGDAARLLGGIGQIERRAFDLAARLVDRLALLGDDHARQPLAVFQDQAREIASAAGRARPAASPPRRAAPRGRHQRAVGIVGAAVRHRGDDLAGRRVLDVDPLLDGRIRPTRRR